jgi:uncharacterized delta-60 repeat protein
MKEVRISKHASTLGRQIQVQRKKIKLESILRGALVASAALSAFANPAMAQAGKLDPAFGAGGIFIESAGEFNNTGTFGTVVALQSNGEIVAGGQIGFNTGVIRLNTNGALDSTFGKSGTVSAILGSNDGNCQVIGLAIQTDGKIVVGITNLQQGFSPLFIVARLNTNGSLDTTFGSGGIVETQVGTFGVAASALALQSDGKILLAGPGAMARYLTNGSLDSSFGSGGIAATPVSGPTAIAEQPDGKILLAAGGPVQGALATPAGLAYAFTEVAGVISRYDANGSLDASFGIAGQAGSLAVVSAIAVQSSGGCVSTCNILGAGTIANNPSTGSSVLSVGFGMVRYTSNGSVDSTFGAGGGVTNSFTPQEPQAAPFALALQTNGDIVAAGTAGQVGSPSFVTQADFALARYTSSGTLDTTFGSNGEATTVFGTNEAAIYGLTIQTDGKIVAVGTSLAGDQAGGLVVARYLGQ